MANPARVLRDAVLRGIATVWHRSQPTTATATACVATWRGIETGWVRSQPRPLAEAQKLLALTDRIRSEYRNKIVAA